VAPKRPILEQICQVASTLLSWLLSISVLKESVTGYALSSFSLRSTNHAGGEKVSSMTVSSLVLERISQAGCLCKAEKRMKVSGSQIAKLKSFSGTYEGRSQDSSPCTGSSTYQFRKQTHFVNVRMFQGASPGGTSVFISSFRGNRLLSGELAHPALCN